MGECVFLDGKHVYLRPLELEDAKGNYKQWFNDFDVCRGNSHFRFPLSQLSIEAYIEQAMKKADTVVLAIVEKGSNQHIGNVALQKIDYIVRQAEFAIVIGQKEAWGKGYGLEAMNLIINHGFNELNLRRIYCGTFEDNFGMQRIAEKLGFKKEGVRKQAAFKSGRYVDVFLYGLLRDRFERSAEDEIL